MTTLVLKSSQNFLLSLINGIMSVFTSIGKAASRTQQIRANEHLATVLKREYPNMTYHELLAHLNQKTISTWK